MCPRTSSLALADACIVRQVSSKFVHAYARFRAPSTPDPSLQNSWSSSPPRPEVLIQQMIVLGTSYQAPITLLPALVSFGAALHIPLP